MALHLRRLLAIFTLGIAPLNVGVAGSDIEETEAAAEPVHPRITVSYETTRIDGPVLPNGYVDYAAALNQSMNRGVTPESNAAVVLWQVMGSQSIPPERRKRFFQMLGVPEPKPDERTWIGLGETPSDPSRPSGAPTTAMLERQLGEAASAPWKVSKYPEIERWIARNDEALGRFTEASRLPHYYSPLLPTQLVHDRDVVMYLGLDDCQLMRMVARTLSARAMLRVGEGRLDEAHHDILTCHRMARLVANHQSFMGRLSGYAIESVAFHADFAISESTALIADQARRFRADLAALPPLPSLAESVDEFERYSLLDNATTLVILGIDPASVFNVPPEGRADFDLDRLKGHPVWEQVDWGFVLKRINHWFDRFAAAAKIVNLIERQTAIRDLLRELDVAKTHWKGRTFPIPDVATEQFSEQVGELYVILLLPAIDQTLDAGARGAIRADLIQLSYALAEHRVKRDRSPSELNELVPDYVGSLPKDPYSGKDFVYRPDGRMYLLYSIGEDRSDDGGSIEGPAREADIRLAIHWPDSRQSKDYSARRSWTETAFRALANGWALALLGLILAAFVLKRFRAARRSASVSKLPEP